LYKLILRYYFLALLRNLNKSDFEKRMLTE